ncbi:CAAX protease self-immunity [Colwellia chukchiensis]|uniref:CAAX protease self-immunity n=1 Tax=Colwellia chukchiensis TaxID=641665 RepID=A0A1H7LNA0_9GAMM|nr:CPBP family intramembrane glutamic endopeptidase [Colwellia chukchiensis]SEL00208.1 CAAX protease self-immunity [Colwellia chukchiensis]
MANSLWTFELREIEFSRNSKLGLSAYTFVTFLVVHTFIAPFVEELMFRGVLLKLWSDKYGYLKAILLTSLLFTLLHSTRFYLDNFILSILLSWIVLQTGTVFYSYVVHATYNLLMWLLEGHNGLLFFANKDSLKLHIFNTWKIEFSLLLLAMIFMPIFVLKFKGKDKCAN